MSATLDKDISTFYFVPAPLNRLSV